MAEALHYQYVDRRLSIAKQLLLSLKSDSTDMVSANTLYQEGVIESAILQVYFAVRHYIDELLESYRLSSVEVEPFAINEDFFRAYNTVTEFIEFKQLLLKQDSWLSIVSCYPSQMISQVGTASVRKSVNQHQYQFIAIDTLYNDKNQLLSMSRALSIIDECCECIHRQREHMVEY